MLLLMNELTKLLLTILLIVNGLNNIQARNTPPVNNLKTISTEIAKSDSLKWSIEFLNKLLNSNGEWYLTNYSYKRPIQGILDYSENDPIDTVVINMHKLLSDKKIV